MSTRRKQKTKRIRPLALVDDCPNCGGEGAVCDKCGKAKSDNCHCEGRYYVPCEKCEGTGVLEK